MAISQAFVPAMIQIADITGPLGVTALMVTFNGALLDAYRAREQGWRKAGRGLAVACALVAVTLGYGAIRLHQVDARRASAPKVRPGSFRPTSASSRNGIPRSSRGCWRRTSRNRPGSRAAAPTIVWPESSYPYPLPRGAQARSRGLSGRGSRAMCAAVSTRPCCSGP